MPNRLSDLSDLSNTIIDGDSRPVKCCYCGKKMYYNGHPKFEPEATIFIDDGRGITTFNQTWYIHDTCLDHLTVFLEKKGKFNDTEKKST